MAYARSFLWLFNTDIVQKVTQLWTKRYHIFAHYEFITTITHILDHNVTKKIP